MAEAARIGVVAARDDPEARLVAARLELLGVSPFFVDLSAFPASTRVQVVVEDDLRILVDGEDVTDARAWYIRRYGFTDPLVRPGEGVTREAWTAMFGRVRAWGLAETEKAMFVGALLSLLEERAPVVNSPSSFVAHLRKPHQVYQLRKASLAVPAWTAGSDEAAARAFAARHARVVRKPSSGGRHVEEVGASDAAAVDPVDPEPVMLQALVEGRHVRAHVVGGALVGAAEVAFDRTQGPDYRVSERGLVPLDLDAVVRGQCVSAAAAVGMEHAGIDLILAEDGRAWFLECNPAAMFLGFEKRTGAPVSEALARRLVDVAKRGV
ncbi:MAG TPA: hypothetical protein VI997_00745 [Candidatus Thermoplasmatota archaeon]|nr:hypothetical protein [Candidatus Thermoplasmatota archaeon]